MPVNILDEESSETVFAPISTDPDLPLVFKPAQRNVSKEVSLARKEENINAHFKVVMGMWISGATTPPVSNAKVSI